VLAGLAGVAHWHGDQAHAEQTGRRDHPAGWPHGLLAQAEQLLRQSQGGSVLNTAFIERLNGTFRERLASLTRKSRHAARRLRALETGMYLIGCTYNFCFAHHELSKAKHWAMACTPAMASGLTDHVWRVGELLMYKAAPPPWVASAREGPPRKRPVSDPEPTRPSLILTHILQMNFVKWPIKPSHMAGCITTSTISFRSTSEPKKMWVRIRL
jgi:hypothetical protein